MNYSERLIQLHEKAAMIDLEQVGALFYPQLPRIFMTDGELMRRLTVGTKYLVAQALLDNLAHCAEGLEVRGLLPHYDFDWSHLVTEEEKKRLEKLRPIAHSHDFSPQAQAAREEYYDLDSSIDDRKPRYWAQGAVRGGGKDPFEMNNSDFLAYSTKQEQSSRRTMLVFGVVNLGVEPLCPVAKLMIVRSNTKVIDDVQIEPIGSYAYKLGDEIVEMKRSDCHIFRQPILFKAHDDIAVRMTTGGDAIGKKSRLMILGMVAQPLGMSILG